MQTTKERIESRLREHMVRIAELPEDEFRAAVARMRPEDRRGMARACGLRGPVLDSLIQLRRGLRQADDF